MRFLALRTRPPFRTQPHPRFLFPFRRPGILAPLAAAAALLGESGTPGVPAAAATPLAVPSPSPESAPPTPPTPVSNVSQPRRTSLHAGSPGVYSIGEPTDEEQLYVEFINRARANPIAESERLVTTTDAEVQSAYSFFSVDKDLVLTQFRSLSAAPPLSIHPMLTDAARRHTEDMFLNEFQGHTGSDGSSVATRATRAGYSWSRLGENVYSNAKSVWHGHAGFNVDWGNGPGGIQTPPGHRLSIHSVDFREIGVGVVLGSRGDVGPQLVTQEFGNRQGLSPFITGVVYYDLNRNQFYDVGEGLGGVRVRASGTATSAITARSGGYSIPVSGNGTYVVTFQVSGLAEVSRTVSVSNDENLKLDHSPTYAAPVLGGSSVVYRNRDNALLFSAVGGATGYDWRSLRRTPWIAPEGVESGLDRFIADVSEGYDVRDTETPHTGVASIHLAHPAPPKDQTLTFRQPVRLGAGSQLSFQSRLTVATPNQVARFDVSKDGGLNWEPVWTQAGAGVPGERAFQRHVASLGSYAGQTVQIRLVYAHESGTYFPQTDSGVGWYVDEILISNAEELSDERIQPVAAGNEFGFRPQDLGGYLLQVRARIGDRILPWGQALSVTAEDGGPVPLRLQIDSLAPAAGGGWSLAFRATEGTAASVEIQSAPSVVGPWSTESSASIATGPSPGTYRAQVPQSVATTRFLRISGR